jgi:hypothetical protein
VQYTKVLQGAEGLGRGAIIDDQALQGWGQDLSGVHWEQALPGAGQCCERSQVTQTWLQALALWQTNSKQGSSGCSAAQAGSEEPTALQCNATVQYNGCSYHCCPAVVMR